MVLFALAAAAFSGCGRPEHAGMAPDVRRELESGRQAVARWLAQERTGRLTDEQVIGLGYAERLRLGLGSPFRLVESALRDPRLSEDMRRETAWLLLSRTLSGDAYEVDPIALDRGGVGGISSWPGLGRHHLRIIENAIVESRDPRGGELAVRLAYQLAAMEGSLPSHAPRFAARAAALVRDRELARTDAARLLRSAEVAQGDPLRAVARWRWERYFRVEAPAMTALPPLVEREALELAPRLAQSLRMLGPRIGDLSALRPAAAEVNRSLLSPAAAGRLAVLADSFNMPPQAPIGIAARAFREEMFQSRHLTDEDREQRERLLAAAQEERVAARYALLNRPTTHDAAPSLALVNAAVALRAYAQEPVWFPGFGGPTSRELEERFGLAAVRFGDDVAAEWRPFYRGMLEMALRDMQRVLPALDVRGLQVRFGASNRSEATLAMHDPRTRELILPPGSAAGTIAHEVAHDLDWQVALKRYRVRGDYASDRAARSEHDRLAARVRSLDQTATLDAGMSDAGNAHARRPAENFARAIDWFVATSLAAQGRTNGYLSSVQDDVLTGYGTVRPPDITGRAGDALINILDEVAPLYPETRDWFLRSYGSARALSSFDLIRAIREVELPAPPMEHATLAPEGVEAVRPTYLALNVARDRGFAAIEQWTCRGPAGAHDGELERARRALVVEATAARARGIALQQAQRIAGPAGARWVARQLYGGPWPQQEIDGAMQDLLAALVSIAREVRDYEVQVAAPRFDLLSATSRCPAFAGAVH